MSNKQKRSSGLQLAMITGHRGLLLGRSKHVLACMDVIWYSRVQDVVLFV